MKSPSQQLATKIISRLISEKIVESDRAERIQNKLASDELSSEDWRLAIELNKDFLEGASNE